MPSYHVGIFQLLEAISLVGRILLIFAMESRGLGYLLEWLFGMWVMHSTGLVESLLFTLYAVVGVVLVVKILQKGGGIFILRFVFKVSLLVYQPSQKRNIKGAVRILTQ